MVRSGRKGYKRVRSLARSGHLGQITAWSCQIWQLEVHTLSQRLRCFPTESRDVIFPQRRQDCPLPLPINRVGFYDLRGEQFVSKVSQKPAVSPNFCRFFFFFFLPLPQETDTVFLQLHRCNHRLNHLITAATTPSANE